MGSRERQRTERRKRKERAVERRTELAAKHQAVPAWIEADRAVREAGGNRPQAGGLK